jgi:hypothetical protein
MKPNDLTIVVNTCDSYCDVLGIFFHAFRDFWSDCSYPVVINTESMTYDHPAKVHLHSRTEGVDDWGARLHSTLSSIGSDYVMVLCDDFILNSPVSNQRIEQAMALLRSECHAVVAYLINTSLPITTIDSDEVFISLKDRVDYRLNSAPAIWRKQALMDYTKVGDTPWAWEVFGTYRTWGDGQVFYTLNPKQEDIYPYNYDKGGAIYRGKWVREVVLQVAHKYSLKIDWEKRGFTSDAVFEKRSLMWKLRFIQTGFRMVGLKALYFVMSYVREKLNAH